MKKVIRLIICFALPLLAGFLGSFFTRSYIDDWYSLLEKPFFSPPNYLFAPVWITLYLFMGLACYLIWQKIDEHYAVREAMGIYWVHLFLNAIWTPIFFGLHSPAIALVIILLLWFLIIALIFKFWNINKEASYLFIPYLIWVSFAIILNYNILILN